MASIENDILVCAYVFFKVIINIFSTKIMGDYFSKEMEFLCAENNS
jgi:hypothetical protein